MKNKIISITENQYLYSVISKVITVLLGIIYLVLFNKYLGTELRGEAAIILNYVSILSIVIGLGIHEAYPYFRKYKNVKLDTFFSNIFICFILLLIGLIVTLSIFDFSKNLFFSIILIPFTVFSRQLNYLAIIEYPKIRNTSTIVLAFFDLVLLLIFYMFFSAEYGTLIVFLYIKELVYLIISFKNIKVKRSFFIFKFNFSSIFDYVKFGFLPMLTLLLISINYRIDILMLEGSVSLSLIGIYSLGVTIAEKIWMIPDALKEIMVSRLAKGAETNEVAKIIRISLFLCILFIVGVLLLGKIMINIVFGIDFIEAYNITAIIVLGVIGMVFYKMVHALNIITGNKNINFIFLLITAVINILGNIISIPKYGIYGSAVTSAISYLLCGIMFVIYFNKKYNIPLKMIFFLQKGDFNIFNIVIKKRK